jgi:histidyl-tRNA synthetase
MQMDSLLKRLGVEGHIIKLNTLGCKKDKAAFTEDLKKYLKAETARLCKECKERLKKNVLRVLDCKNESCIAAASGAPNILENLCASCSDHFNRLKGSLTKLGIPFKESKNLVRGLDYYTGTVFEVVHPALGGQDAIGAGGRYDNLVKDMGGADIPAVGYALGIERLIIALKDEIRASVSPKRIIYIATMGEGPKIHGIQFAEKIRGDKELEGKVIVLTDIKEASLKSQMRAADKLGAGVVLIIGEDEIKCGCATLKDMQTKEEVAVSFDRVIEAVKEKIC